MGARLPVVILFVFGLLSGFIRDFSRDFHWHVVLGRFTLANGRLMHEDVLSHTYAGRHLFQDSWLGDLLLALAYEGGGVPGAYLLRGVCTGLTWALLGREMLRRGLPRLGAVLWMLLILGELWFRLYLRPETITFALLATVLVLLSDHERGGPRARLWWLVPLTVLWANVHGSVSLGLAAIGLYAAERLFRAWREPVRDMAQLRFFVVLPLVCGLASAANPEGIREPLMFLFVRDDDPTFQSGVEWRPLALGTMTPVFPALILTIGVSSLLAGRQTPLWLNVLFLFVFSVSLQHSRFIKAALLTSAPLVAANFAAIRLKLEAEPLRWTPTQLGRGVSALAGLGVVYLLGVVHPFWRELGLDIDHQRYPVPACEFAHEAKFSGHMLNTFEHGSYLLFCLPEHPVYIDQRAAALYDAAFTRHYYTLGNSPQLLKQGADEAGVTWAFVGYGPIAEQMAADPQTWRLVWFDDLALIYVRRDLPAAALWTGDDVSELEPARVVQLVNLSGPALERAQRQVVLQLSRDASGKRSALVAAAVAIAAHDEPAFGRLEPRLREMKLPEASFLIGTHAMAVGKFRDALVAFAEMGMRGGDPRASLVLQASALTRLGQHADAERLMRAAGQP